MGTVGALLMASVTWMVVAPPAARAEEDAEEASGGTEIDLTGTTLTVTAGAPGSLTLTSRPGAGGTGPTVRCAWLEIVIGGPAPITVVPVLDPVEGDYYQLDCWTSAPAEPQGGYPITVRYPGRAEIPGPAIGTGEAARFAVDHIDFAPPSVVLSPPAGQIVGIPTWLAVTSRLDYEPVSAQAGPVWATVRPEFRNVVWDLGNGDRRTCTTDATTTWDPGGPASQRSECTYTYESTAHESAHGSRQPGEPFAASATVNWTVHELTDKSDGEWQVWGTVSLTTPVQVPVGELQAAIR